MSYISIGQTSYLPTDISPYIGIDTLSNGKVVIWFDHIGARDLKRKNEQLKNVKKGNNILREQKYVLQSILDSCEAQKNNLKVVTDTIVKTVEVVDNRYRSMIVEKEVQRKRATIKLS